MAKHKTPVQWGNSVGRLDFSENRKRKCCVGHPLWTSSNQWRKTRWSRLWEFLGHRSNVNINRKTQQFIAGDLLQFHWMFCCPPKKKTCWKNTSAYTMGNSVGCLDFLENRKRKRCVAHSWWTSSNRLRNGFAKMKWKIMDTWKCWKIPK